MRELTEKEKKALDISADLWNEFLELPILLKEDQQDFRFHINALQNLILCRPAFESNNKAETDETKTD